MNALARMRRAIDAAGIERDPILRGGTVVAIHPNVVIAKGLSDHAALGDFVSLGEGEGRGRGEVVQIEPDRILVAPCEGGRPLSINDAVIHRGSGRARPDERWLGRVVNAIGEPVDGKGPLAVPTEPPVAAIKRPAMMRARIDEPFRTGVRVIDIFTPLCIGQRFGVFAGSGVGKSTLLAMLARAEAFDAVVVSLVGERTREVREFLEDTLGPEGMKKSVAVVATSDESATMRRRAPVCAMEVAEWFRDRGKRVLLLLDSVTRYAHALREVAISVGEPPVARGYPASVFTDLPRLLERAGPGGPDCGSITAIVTVLVDGDDHNDPVADTLRGILDGHLVLQRSIANRGRFPAVDPLGSVSRLAARAWTEEQSLLVSQLRSMIALFEETRDLRMMSGWQQGTNPELDQAVMAVPRIYEALSQTRADPPQSDPFTQLADHLRHDKEKSQPH
ncbi:FliI/YscN family ATPase [Oricola cellulosilytica]|uniref:Flagellar protein export ATPase FliI n=1 Tax=Oricola cellulosilytica TaxID=1429082 RepID=A0A4R0PH45_9HYPH|nr:FliI/YscN family ATPase [Oricola cellulosilytica]TCD16193.1 flagellar protein export ATPase FliI [Oricola cellulosilytica]